MIVRTLVCLGLALTFVACSKKDDAAERRAAEAEVAAQMPSGPAELPVQDAPAEMPADASTSGTGGPSSLPTADAEFDPTSIPVTSVSLPPFPFFKDPEGLVNDLQGKDTVVAFDRHYFIVGNKLVPLEGKLGLFQYNLENPPSGRKYSQVEFLRNYENAITALGGRKVSTAQYSPELLATLAGGREEVERYRHATAPADRRAEHYAYLIRTADKEYWIHVSAGDTIPLMGFITALEKQVMQSSIAFLDA